MLVPCRISLISLHMPFFPSFFFGQIHPIFSDSLPTFFNISRRIATSYIYIYGHFHHACEIHVIFHTSKLKSNIIPKGLAGDTRTIYLSTCRTCPHMVFSSGANTNQRLHFLNPRYSHTLHVETLLGGCQLCASFTLHLSKTCRTMGPQMVGQVTMIGPTTCNNQIPTHIALLAFLLFPHCSSSAGGTSTVDIEISTVPSKLGNLLLSIYIFFGQTLLRVYIRFF